MYRGHSEEKQVGYVAIRRLWSGVSIRMTEKLHDQGVEEDFKFFPRVSKHCLGVGVGDRFSTPWMQKVSTLC